MDIIKSGGYKISGFEIESVPTPRDGHCVGQWEYGNTMTLELC